MSDPLDDPILLAFAEILREELAKICVEFAVLEARVNAGAEQLTECRDEFDAVGADLSTRILAAQDIAEKAQSDAALIAGEMKHRRDLSDALADTVSKLRESIERLMVDEARTTAEQKQLLLALGEACDAKTAGLDVQISDLREDLEDQGRQLAKVVQAGADLTGRVEQNFPVLEAAMDRGLKELDARVGEIHCRAGALHQLIEELADTTGATRERLAQVAQAGADLTVRVEQNFPVLEAAMDRGLKDLGDKVAKIAADVEELQDEADQAIVRLNDSVDAVVTISLPKFTQEVRAAVIEDLDTQLLDMERRAVLAVSASIPAPRDGRDGRDLTTPARDGKDGEPGRDGEFSEPKAWGGSAKRGELITHRGGLWYVMRDTESAPNLGDDWRLVCDGISRTWLEAGSPGELAIALERTSGDVIREAVRVPGNVYRGVWVRPVFEQTYRAGDSVTHQGSTWIAERDTASRPGDDDSGWRLAVKRGGDGRDGKSFDWCGQWNAGRKYKPGDTVKAAGGVFIALKITEASPPLRTDRNDDWEALIHTPPDDERLT